MRFEIVRLAPFLVQVMPLANVPSQGTDISLLPLQVGEIWPKVVFSSFLTQMRENKLLAPYNVMFLPPTKAPEGMPLMVK